MKHIKKFESFLIKEENNTNNIDIEEIMNNYFEAALWTEEDNEELEGKTIYDFSEESKAKTKSEIEWFINNAGDAINGISNEMIGHDIWLSRNRHGAGFFDRNYESYVEEKLMSLAQQMGEVIIEVNSEGKVEVSGGNDLN